LKTVLVTGCSGYIGSHLVKHLEGKYKVLGLDIAPPDYSLENFIRHDIKKPVEFTWLHVDAIVHLAAKVRVGESKKCPTEYYDTNLLGTLNILEGISTNNFIFASTGVAEYCNDPYGISKKAAEDCVAETANNYTTFRFYNVIGSDGFPPTNPDGLMYNLQKAESRGSFTIYGKNCDTRDGTCERDYIHVKEVCHAIEKAIDDPAQGIECLGHGKGYTVKEIVALYKELHSSTFSVRYAPKRQGDLDKTVLMNTSRYMEKLYSIEELLK